MFLGRGSASVTEPRVRRGDPEVPWPELQTATDSPASAAAQRRLEQASARAKASPRGSAAAKAATSPVARPGVSEPGRQSVTFRNASPPPVEVPSQGQAGPSPSRSMSAGSNGRVRRWSTEGDFLAPSPVQLPPQGRGAEAVEVGRANGRESARELSRETYENRKPSAPPSRDAGSNSRNGSSGGGSGLGSKDGKRQSVSSSSRRSSSSARLHVECAAVVVPHPVRYWGCAASRCRGHLGAAPPAFGRQPIPPHDAHTPQCTNTGVPIPSHRRNAPIANCASSNISSASIAMAR